MSVSEMEPIAQPDSGSLNRSAIGVLTGSHFLIDLCQGIVPAMLPFLLAEGRLSYSAAGWLVFAIAASSSVIQPLFGYVADRVTSIWLMPVSILVTGCALIIGLIASAYSVLVGSLAICGIGVAAFHPEAARLALIAAGRQRTTGMSYFSVGGNIGFATAPIVTMTLFTQLGIDGIVVMLIPIVVMTWLSLRTAAQLDRTSPMTRSTSGTDIPPDRWVAFGLLALVTIGRSIVFFGLNTFLALYWMSHFEVTASQATTVLGVFLAMGIGGTLLGGRLADRLDRRAIVRVSFFISAIGLPAVLFAPTSAWAMVVLIPLAVSFFMSTSVLVVLGQEYLPNRVGMASGVTLGLAISVGGMVTPLLGLIADAHGPKQVLIVLEGILIFALICAMLLPPTMIRMAKSNRHEN